MNRTARAPGAARASAVRLAKGRVHAFWSAASCGEVTLLPGRSAEDYASQRLARYRLEPFIPAFANFGHYRGRRVLEIGVGLGADHESFARAGAELHGIDLTRRAIEHTHARLEAAGLRSHLAVADAEDLPYPDQAFDLVYSWGVLHHSSDPRRAIDEVWRVLRPGGVAKLMLYQAPSIVGFMLWARHGVLAGAPRRSLASLFAEHVESPGTRAFSIDEARALCSGFDSVSVAPVLSHGDLLSSHAGQRHAGPLLDVARRLWPRRVIRRCLPARGLFLLITASKAAR